MATTTTFPGCTQCCTVPCIGCSTYPTVYKFTFAGVTNNSCSSCSVVNRQFNMTFTTTPLFGSCGWLEEPAIKPCGGAGTIKADASLFESGTKVICRVRLRDNTNGLIQVIDYTKTLSAWNCLSANTMDYDTVNNVDTACKTFPATITVEPF